MKALLKVTQADLNASCAERVWVGEIERVRVGGACGPPPPVAAPLASSLRAPSRGDPPLKDRRTGTPERRCLVRRLEPFVSQTARRLERFVSQTARRLERCVSQTARRLEQCVRCPVR